MKELTKQIVEVNGVICDCIATLDNDGKTYVVYTDNKYNKQGQLNIYGGLLVENKIVEINNPDDELVIKDIINEVVNKMNEQM